MLKGKTVVLGVTGSIAAYKIASLASMLIKQHADVHVIMTQNATNFIHPTAFETLTRHKCLVDTFDRDFQFNVKHVSLAQQADVMMIAPASANVIGKLAHGIADDMLTTTAMACKAPMLIVPTMNTNMYENPILQDNLKVLASYGKKIIEPASGMLACRDVGKGKMPEPEVLFQHILRMIAFDKDLAGKKVLVTAGPTQEAIDPVRYITNHSTGKMGYAIAENAMLRGADVTLVTGPCAVEPPMFVKVKPVISAQDMYEAVTEEYDQTDIVIMTAQWRITVRHRSARKKSRNRIVIFLFRWYGQKIYWQRLVHPRHISFCVVFPWRHRICWKTPEQRLQRKIWI